MNDPEHVLGIDIGTNSGKGVIVHRDGTVKATHTVEHSVTFPRPGWAEQDADAVWWSSFVEIVRRLLASSGVAAEDIAAVGCSAIGITMLPVDSQGRPLRTSVLYGIDTRALREIEHLNAVLGAETIFARSGSYLSANSVGPKILWFRNNQPELFARTHKILTASSYLTFRLTGTYSIDAFSAQGMAPMFDAAAQCWDAEGTEPVCPMDLLPPIHSATDVIGTVHSGAAAETGLAEGTPVIAGTVDAAVEAISVGVTSPGDTMLMLGSTAFITHIIGSVLRTKEFWSSRFLVEDTFTLSAGLATSAAVTRWFKDQFGQSEVLAEERDGINAYGLLAQQAAEVPPGSEGLIVLPYFSGERAPIHDPKARGLIAGLTLSHTRKHLYRAILEGVAYSLRHNLDIMESLGARPTRLTAVGGGSKNPLWLQIIADCTGKTIQVPSLTIGASYGDAYMACVGGGIFSDFGALRDWISIDRVVEPDPRNDDVYNASYEIYRRCYPNLVNELHGLADLQVRAS